MATLAEARTTVTTAISKISAQRMDPSTTAEQLVALDAAVEQLLPKLHEIEIAQLDQSASAVADAATSLQAVTKDARLDTLSQLKQQLGMLQAQLDDQHSGIFAATKLARATDPAAPLPAPGEAPAQAAAPGAAHAPAETPAGFKPINSTRFGDLREEYQQLYASCSILPARQSIVRGQLAKLLAGRERYTTVAADTPGMPWYLVGIIHGMEADYRFTGHQHNGDPLTARTVNVPAGRPPLGHPPFTWEESARDALQFDGLSSETDFSLAHLLYFFEKFNGFGYRSRGIPSPYVWGYTNHYKSGKFVADHLFSATAVSDQAGAAVLLKELEAQSTVLA